VTGLAPSTASAPTGSFDESRRTAPHVTIRGLSKHYPDATIYDKFDGASSNYDGAGRNASDNNTLFLFLWAAI